MVDVRNDTEVSVAAGGEGARHIRSPVVKGSSANDLGWWCCDDAQTYSSGMAAIRCSSSPGTEPMALEVDIHRARARRGHACLLRALGSGMPSNSKRLPGIRRAEAAA